MRNFTQRPVLVILIAWFSGFSREIGEANKFAVIIMMTIMSNMETWVFCCLRRGCQAYCSMNAQGISAAHLTWQHTTLRYLARCSDLKFVSKWEQWDIFLGDVSQKYFSSLTDGWNPSWAEEGQMIGESEWWLLMQFFRLACVRSRNWLEYLVSIDWSVQERERAGLASRRSTQNKLDSQVCKYQLLGIKLWNFACCPPLISCFCFSMSSELLSH